MTKLVVPFRNFVNAGRMYISTAVAHIIKIFMNNIQYIQILRRARPGAAGVSLAF
jgi:hypothetical protein